MSNTQSNKELIKVSLRSNQPILLKGYRGTGKSETIKAVCKEEGYTVITRNLNGAESYEVVSGLPRQDGSTFNYLVPLWWQKINDLVKNGNKVCVFFDEINHALPEVLNGLHGVLDPERRIAGLEIPEVRIVAAGNMEDENDTLTTIPEPLLDRFALQIDNFINDEARDYLKNKYPEMCGIIDIIFTKSDANPRRVEKLLICIKNGLTDAKQISKLTTKEVANLIIPEINKGNFGFNLVNESDNLSKKEQLIKQLNTLDKIDLVDVLKSV